MNIEFGELCDLLHNFKTAARVSRHLQVPAKSIYSELRSRKLTVRQVLRESPLPLERVCLVSTTAGIAASPST